MVQRHQWPQQLAALEREFMDFLGPFESGWMPTSLQADHEKRGCVSALQAGCGELPKAASWLDLHTPRLRRQLVREMSCIVIQANFRGSWCRREVMQAVERYRSLRRAGALNVQRRWRGGVSRTYVLNERAARAAYQEKLLEAATLIQRIWRGKQTRFNLRRHITGLEICSKVLEQKAAEMRTEWQEKTDMLMRAKKGSADAHAAYKSAKLYALQVKNILMSARLHIAWRAPAVRCWLTTSCVAWQNANHNTHNTALITGNRAMSARVAVEAIEKDVAEAAALAETASAAAHETAQALKFALNERQKQLDRAHILALRIDTTASRKKKSVAKDITSGAAGQEMQADGEPAALLQEPANGTAVEPRAVAEAESTDPSSAEPAAEAAALGSAGQAASLRVFFDQVDTDSSGTLSSKELKRALRAVGLPKTTDFDEVFAAFDTDGDESVSFDEFEANLLPRTRAMIEKCLDQEGRMEGFRPLVDVAKVFAQFDTDDSGTLTKIELKRAFACLGLKKLDIDEVLAAFDTDGDEQIDLAEWKAGLKPETLRIITKKLDENGLVAGFVDDGRGRTKPEPAAGAAAAAAAAVAVAGSEPAAKQSRSVVIPDGAVVGPLTLEPLMASTFNGSPMKEATPITGQANNLIRKLEELDQNLNNAISPGGTTVALTTALAAEASGGGGGSGSSTTLGGVPEEEAVFTPAVDPDVAAAAAVAEPAPEEVPEEVSEEEKMDNELDEALQFGAGSLLDFAGASDDEPDAEGGSTEPAKRAATAEPEDEPEGETEPVAEEGVAQPEPEDEEVEEELVVEAAEMAAAPSAAAAAAAAAVAEEVAPM